VSGVGKRTGLFGGSFDPLHLGHLILAQDALEACSLDTVLFIPAAQNPLKDNAPVASDAARLAMLEAALADFPAFAIDSGELEAGGHSYTIDTVRRLQQERPGERLVWLTGADALADLPKWREAEALAALVEFAVMGRPGGDYKVPEIPSLRVQIINGHQVEISSTDIRERLANGASIRHLVPEAVHQFIQKQNLYLRNSTLT